VTNAERVIREHAETIRDLILADITNAHSVLVELAVERANTIGAAEYGDASFHKTLQELTLDRYEEYADAYFYAGVAIDNQLKE